MICTTCNNEAEHQLSYSSILSDVNWLGNYCTKCFIKKLRGMAMVHNNKLKFSTTSRLKRDVE